MVLGTYLGVVRGWTEVVLGIVRRASGCLAGSGSRCRVPGRNWIEVPVGCLPGAWQELVGAYARQDLGRGACVVPDRNQ